MDWNLVDQSLEEQFCVMLTLEGRVRVRVRVRVESCKVLARAVVVGCLFVVL